MKNIIIMGASSGIGLSVAEAFASRGLRVGLAARHTSAFLELKKKYPENVEYESIDITHRDAPGKLGALITRLGGMDLYFHCSGVGFDNSVLDPQVEADTLDVNVVGFARMLSAAYDWFRDNGGRGRIAAITSVAGTKGIGTMSAYSSSKKFDSTYMVALEQLANLQGVDIKFTDIRPGWIKTPLVKEGVDYPMMMTLEEATPLIIKAIVKHPRVAVIGWRWKLLTAAMALLPDCLWIKIDPKMANPGD